MTAPDLERASSAFARLVQVMARLRGSEGCPWDREQDFASLRRYTLEEAYEVVEAIDHGDRAALRSELGDLLLQVVFLAQLAIEEGSFDIADVAESIRNKLERRHPHVFGTTAVDDADEVVRNWEAIKRGERGDSSLLDDVPLSLPALERAQKLGKRAAQLNFDWKSPAGVLDKIDEELSELREAVASESRRRAEEELGDLLFTVANLARHLGVSAEVALLAAAGKFERRFRVLERDVTAGKVGTSGHQLDEAWERIKKAGDQSTLRAASDATPTPNK